jgi:hypothetical protein
MCRKHHGALYGTMVSVEPKNFHWLQGQEAVVRYRSSPTLERPFCSHCGSTVPDVSGEACICPAGTFDDDLEMKPQAHIFTASKSPMCEITDTLPQFDEYPPGFGSALPAPPSRVAASTQSDSVQGSCLCGAVAFEIDAAPPRLVNCHCSRCRRSRGAAHGTNFFARMEQFRWTRGAEKVRTYKLPDASLFTTGFCTDCGSLMPSAFEALRRYIVPVGSIDTPLTIKPADDAIACVGPDPDRILQRTRQQIVECLRIDDDIRVSALHDRGALAGRSRQDVLDVDLLTAASHDIGRARGHIGGRQHSAGGGADQPPVLQSTDIANVSCVVNEGAQETQFTFAAERAARVFGVGQERADFIDNLFGFPQHQHCRLVELRGFPGVKQLSGPEIAEGGSNRC